jgi:hypothetical protein
VAAPQVVAGSVTATAITTSAGSWTATMPPVINDGDIVYAYLRINLLGATLSTLPSGWNAVALTAQSGSGAHFMLYKVSDGTDDGSSVVFNSSATANPVLMTMFVVEDADTATPVEAHSSVAAPAGTTFNIPAITTLGSDRLVMTFGNINITTFNSGGAEIFTWGQGTKLFEQIAGTNRSMSGAWFEKAAAGSTGVMTCTIPSAAAGGVAIAIPPGAAETVPPAVPTGLGGSVSDYAADTPNAVFRVPTVR